MCTNTHNFPIECQSRTQALGIALAMKYLSVYS